MVGEKFQVTLPEPLAKQLKEVSTEKGLSKSVLLTRALEQYFITEKEDR